MPSTSYQRKARYYMLSWLKHDLKASITVFFVALPLCLGVAMSSGVPVLSGLIAGIIGGVVITTLSKSTFSVSGPAAGLTAICAAAIAQLGALELFYLSVAVAGLLQILLGVLFAIPLLNQIPYCVLAVILIRTGYNLVKPKAILVIYKQGREQFLPFMVTVVSILLTDLLIGVLIGMAYAIYFLIKYTYHAGFTLKEHQNGHIQCFTVQLALNVSFLNKERFVEMLDKLPEYASVEIIGSDSVYIDHDILEIFQEFKAKAHNKHIDFKLIDVPSVENTALH
ncbi:MAG: SulP family inorganic anion transporter [Saprospiraceae bacterium]|nr:SulP family inorganic anion transporter [Saprospiraceae bacterium]